MSDSELINTRGSRSEVLVSLLKWRYLGIQELMEVSGYEGSRKSLNKLLLRLEKENLVGSFPFPLANRKFWYLTGKTWKYYTAERSILNANFKYVDAIGSSLLYRLSRLPYVEDIRFKHLSKDQSPLRANNPYNHYGYFSFNENGDSYPFALNVEGERKTRGVLDSEFESIYAGELKALFYFFNHPYILNYYFEQHWDFQKRHNIKAEGSKVFFCLSDDLAKQSLNILDIETFNSEGGKETLEVFLDKFR